MAKKPTSKHFVSNQKKINTEWLRNASKSLGMNGLEVLKDLTPNISDTTSVSTNITREVVKNVKDIRTGTIKVNELIKRNRYVNLAQKGLKNAMEDLKAGNFNNEQRESEAFLGSSEDSGMFFDDSDTNSSSESNTIINNGPSDASMAMVNNSIMANAEAQLRGAQATVDTLVAVTSASMTQQQDLNNRILTGLDNINNNLASLVAFQNDNMNRFIESSTAFMEKMGSSLDRSNESNNENKRISVNDIFNNKGQIEAGKYKELVKSQFNDWFSETMPGFLKDQLDAYGEILVANPLKGISKILMEQAIPGAIKKGMKSVDDTYGGFLPMFLERLSSDFGNSTDRGAKGEFKRAIGSIFGLRNDRKNQFDMSNKITESAVSFTKVDHFAISELIPKYLRESNSYLKSIAEAMNIDTRKAELNSDVFDYKEGKYIKSADIQKGILEELTSSVTNAFRSSVFGKELVKMGEETSALNDKQKAKYDKVLDQFFVQLERNGTPNLSNGNMEEIDKILDNINADNYTKGFLKMSLQDMIKKRHGAINMGSAIRSASKSLSTTRDNMQENASLYHLFSVLNGTESLDDSMMHQMQGLLNPNRNADVSLAGANGINIPISGGIFGGSPNTSGNKQNFKTHKISNRQRAIIQRDLDRMNPNVDIASLSPTEKAAYTANKGMYDVIFGKGIESEKLKSTMDKLLDSESNNPFAYLTKKLSDVANKLDHELTGKEYTDSKGIKHDKKDLNGKKVTLVDALKTSTTDVINDLKTSIFGKKNEEGKREGGAGFVQFARKTFNEGIQGYSDAFFGENTENKSFKERFGDFISDKLEKAKNLLPKELKDSLNENGDAAVKGGLIGTLVGGPIIGGLTGAAAGLFSKSKTFQEFLYGKENENGEKDGGLFKIMSNAWNTSTKTKDGEPGVKIDGKKLSMAAVGTGAGFLASFFTPVGPIGGAAIGLASSMIASNDKFRKFLFGSDEPSDDEPGLTGRFANMFDAYVLRPMKDKGASMLDGAKDFVKDAMLDPILFAVEPIVNMVGRKFSDITSFIGNKITETIDVVKTGFVDFVTNTSAKLFKTIGNFLSPVTSIAVGMVKGVASMPGKMIGKIGDYAEKRNRKASVERIKRENVDGIYDDLLKRYNAGDQDAIEEAETMYYRSEFRNKNKSQSESDREARKQKRKENAQARKDKQENIQFITRMTGGALKEDTPENRRKAMEIYNSKLKENKGKLFKSDKVFGYRDFKFKGDADVVENGDATQSENPTNTTADRTRQATEETAENTRRITEEISALNENLSKLLSDREKLRERGREIRETNKANGNREFDYGENYIKDVTTNEEEIKTVQDEVKKRERELAQLNPSRGRKFLNGLKRVGSSVRYGVVRGLKIPRNLPHYARKLRDWVNTAEGIDELTEQYRQMNREGGEGGYGSPFTNAGHYVVANGMDNNGNLFINNPNDRSGSKKYNMASVLKQTGRAWGLSNISGGRGVLNNDNKDNKLHVVIDEIRDKSPIETIVTGTRGILPVFSFGTRRSTTNSKQAIDAATKSDGNLTVDDLAADFHENDAVMSTEENDKSLFGKIGDFLSGLGSSASTIVQSLASGNGLLSTLTTGLVGSSGILGILGKIATKLGIGGTVAAGAGLALDYFTNNKDTNKNTFLTNDDGSLVLDENGNPVQMTEQNKSDKSRNTFGQKLRNWVTPNKTRVNTDKDSEDYGKWTTQHTFDSKTGVRASAATGVALKTSGTIIEKFLPLAKEAIELLALKLGELLQKHGMNAKTVDKILDITGTITSKLTREAAEKHTSKIGVAFAKIGASGGTLAMADAAFLVIGALSGLTSPGELFEVNMDDPNLDSFIKNKMRLISTVFKGFLNTSVGTIIDVVDIIVSSVSNFSPIKWLAQQVLKLWLDDVDDDKVAAAKENMKNDYNASLQNEYEAYLSGLSDSSTAMSMEEFSNSNLATSFSDYNTSQNRSIFNKVGNSLSTAWDGAQNSFKVMRNTSNSTQTPGVSTMKTSNYTSGTSTPNAGGMKYGALNGGYGEKVNGSTFYSQKDPRWKNAGYGMSGDTMGNAGCGPTAMAMALSDATGKNINPMQMASMAQSGGFRDGTGTNASFINAASNAFGVSTKESINPNENFIRNELSSGNPVVLLGQSGGFGGEPFTRAGHFNYATDIDKNGNVTVNDPRGKTYSKKYKLDKLAKQTGRAWSLQSGRGPLSTNTDNIESRHKWLAIVRAVKKAIADTQSGYSQTNYIKITIGEKTLSVRTDCSGFVTACLKFYGVLDDGVNLASQNYANPDNEILKSTGFTPSAFTSWESLKEGDIIALNGHVEIFAGNESGVHKVYNVGSDNSANNPNKTVSGHSTYTTVWSPDGSSSSNAITSLNYSTDASISSTSEPESKSSGLFDIFGTIGRFFKSAASKAMKGFTTNEWDTDYSDVFGTKTSDHAYGSTNQTTPGISTYHNAQSVDAAKTYQSSESEPIIYKYLRSKGYTKAGAAGLMGNLSAESGLRPNNLQNSYEKSLGSDTEYTSRVDSGQQDFVNDSAGYGLAQWTSANRKQGLLNYAKTKGKSISDLQAQLEWLNREMSTSYKGVEDILKKTDNVVEASNYVLHKFENPADQGPEVEQKRASYGQAIFEKYANQPEDLIPGTNQPKPFNFNTITSGAGEGSSMSKDIRYSNGIYEEQPKKSSAFVNNYETTSRGNVSNVANDSIRIMKDDEEKKILYTIASLLESVVANTGDSSSKLDYLKNLKTSGGNVNTFVSGGNTVNNNSSYNTQKSTPFNKQYMTAAQISKG